MKRMKPGLLQKGSSGTKSIVNRFRVFVSLLIVCLTVFITLFTYIDLSKNYREDIYKNGSDKALMIAGNVERFMDGAYSLTEGFLNNSDIMSMDTNLQNPILAEAVSRNSYLELLYIQDASGMQTGRSSGTLADRSSR